MEINGIGVNIPNPAKTDRGRTTTPPATTAFRCLTRPHGRIGVVVCFDRHYPESIRSTVGAITEYSEEAASTTLRHLLSTIRQVELPKKTACKEQRSVPPALQSALANRRKL